MASYVFNHFKAELMRANVDMAAADNIFYVALVNTSAFSPASQPDTSAWNSVSGTWDIGADATKNSTAYTSGVGLGLSALTVSAALGADESRWDANDVTWASSTIDADGAVIYRASDNLMLCAIDFASTKSSSNGDFTISWNAQGIINLG